MTNHTCDNNCEGAEDVENVLSVSEILEQCLEDEVRDGEVALASHAALQSGCTYSKSYLRQRIYSCRTCLTAALHESVGAHNREDFFSAICLPCALRCHDGHDLLELEYKRHIRCDCGSNYLKDQADGGNGDLRDVRFPSSHSCKYPPSDREPGYNLENAYNHNYDGKYCWCESESIEAIDVTDAMYQCVVCEDWYHSNCIGEVPPDADDTVSGFYSYVCRDLNSMDHITNTKQEGTDCKIPAYHRWCESASIIPQHSNCTFHSIPPHLSRYGTCHHIPLMKTLSSPAHPVKLHTIPSHNDNKVAKDQRNIRPVFCDVFWMLSTWRQDLCRCHACVAEYRRCGVMFLIDNTDGESDDGNNDESPTNAANPSSYDLAVAMFRTLPAERQTEATLKFNDFQNHMKLEIRKIGDAGRVVTADDVRAIAEEFKQKEKRRRLL